MRMTNYLLTFMSICLATLVSLPANAEGQKTLAATLNIYVFPAGGQGSAQQSTDEVNCYNWAVQNTGADPFELSPSATQQAQQSSSAQQQASKAGAGSGARGAVRGAAAGALIGEIVDDDASKGAAYGAAAGFLRGRHQARQARIQAQQRNQSQQQAGATQMDNFKRAFSVCLEAKNYMVK